ncbi:MAG TPA: hypothetical protein DD413_01910 [Ruminococcus sp.]|nr:hypothetical protein [Ruminococcus sp.]
MNEFSENTVFMVNALEKKLDGNEVDIENFCDTVNSVFEERENVLKNVNKAVINNFKEIMKIGGKTEATAATVVSKLSKGTRAFTREYAIMFCYAAGNKTEEADNQLRKIFLVDGFHLRNYEDLIDSFYLRENTIETCVEKFAAAYKMKTDFKPLYDKAEVKASVESSAADNFREYTAFFEERSETINNAEQLANFLRSDDSLQKAGVINRTSKSYLYDVLIELCAKIIDNVNIPQSNDELEQLYNELDSKRLYESIIKLLQNIFDPYSYYDLRKIDNCTRPEYYERYSGNNSRNSLTQTQLKQMQIFNEVNKKAEIMLRIWNSNYNDISVSFEKSLENEKFDSLIEYLVNANGSSKPTVIGQIKSVYFHSMFNLMVYDSKWGLADFLGLPRNRTESSMTVNEDAVEGSSTLRGINQMEETYFFYSPELSMYVIDYMTDADSGKFLNICIDEGVHVKPFTVEVNSVRDLLFIAESMLNADSDDNIEDYIDKVIVETGEISNDHSAFSQNLSKLVNEMNNTKSTSANAMLISRAPTVNRTLLAFCLVLRELLNTPSKDSKTILNNVNQSLNHCKIAQLNPHNPLDLLLLGSIYTISPLSYIKAYMLYMMPNI